MSVAAQRTKRRQHREETRRQILDAAKVFLQEHSFRELGVDTLMGATGHSRTVFYRHFEDIPALVLTLITEVSAEMVEFSVEWGRSDRVGPDEARSRLATYVDFYARNGPLVRALTEASHHDELVADANRRLVDGFMTLTAEAVQRRIDSGDLEPLDAPEISRALVWMLNGYLLDKLGRPGETDPERVLETVWTIWTRTLFPAAGPGPSA